MNTLAYRREIDEAVDAANYAIKCLRKAHDELNGAKNWGIVDILGGGMLTTFLKRNKMNNAESDIAEAKRAMQVFQKELYDVDTRFQLDLNTSDFLAFADYFFDGVVADFLVQSQIKKTQREILLAIKKIEELRNQLLVL